MLELLLALAILGGALAVLSRIAETGTDAALEARGLSVARLACQSRLSEVLLEAESGIMPSPIFDAPLVSGDSGLTTPLTHTIEVAPGSIDGLMTLRLTVHVGGLENPLVNYSLSRSFIDPTMDLLAMEMEELEMRAQMQPESSTASDDPSLPPDQP